jgi:hypothetical protein
MSIIDQCRRQRAASLAFAMMIPAIACGLLQGCAGARQQVQADTRNADRQRAEAERAEYDARQQQEKAAQEARRKREETQSIDVRADWKEYVMANYQESVKDQLLSPASARFEKAPTLFAAYCPGLNYVTISAVGSVDAQNAFGGLLRRTYFVTWKQTGSPTTVGNDWGEPAVIIGGR